MPKISQHALPHATSFGLLSPSSGLGLRHSAEAVGNAAALAQREHGGHCLHRVCAYLMPVACRRAHVSGRERVFQRVRAACTMRERARKRAACNAGSSRTMPTGSHLRQRGRVKAGDRLVRQGLPA